MENIACEQSPPQSPTKSELIVLAVKSYNPIENDITDNLAKENTEFEPQLSEQLIVKKGNRFTVKRGSVDWWLYVKSDESQNWGFIPSTHVVPLKRDLTPEE